MVDSAPCKVFTGGTMGLNRPWCVRRSIKARRAGLTMLGGGLSNEDA